MNSDNVEKFFNEVPNKAASPVTEKILVPPSYDEAIHIINNIINTRSVNSSKLNKSGKLLGNRVNLTDGSQVVGIVITCYIQSLRNELSERNLPEEESQNMLVAIKNYENILTSVLKLQKDLNLSLDCNSVITIIHGAVTELMTKELKND